MSHLDIHLRMFHILGLKNTLLEKGHVKTKAKGSQFDSL